MVKMFIPYVKYEKKTPVNLTARKLSPAYEYNYN